MQKKSNHTKILGVNIDHIATLRNAREDGDLSLILAAQICKKAGASGITIHLREDRRHIRDLDVSSLSKHNILPINLEIAATEEMVQIAIQNKVDSVCFVPEKREERTTESGLDIAMNFEKLQGFMQSLNEYNINVSLFVDTDKCQIELGKKLGAQKIEIHTGGYARNMQNIDDIRSCAMFANNIGLEVHAGHGLTLHNLPQLLLINEISGFNIGYSIICNSIFAGLESSVREIYNLIHNS